MIEINLVMDQLIGSSGFSVQAIPLDYREGSLLLGGEYEHL